MKWYEVTLVSTHEGADLFADALFSVGCGGVSIYDKQDIVALYDSDIVWDYIDENLVNNLDNKVACEKYDATHAEFHRLLHDEIVFAEFATALI